MSTGVKTTAVPAAERSRVPPLRPGDRLTAEEFERRFDAMPDCKKAELINGVVYMPSPVIFEDHGGPHFDFIGWLSLYRIATPGIRGGDNTTLRLPLANRPQPDAFLVILPSFGGRVRIDADGYIVGAPEFLGEIAATSENYDLHEKLDLYQQVGVQEYLVWRVFDREIDWFVLRQGRYERLLLTETGLYQSEILPGLWLDPAAFVSGDMVKVAQVAQEGIAGAAHADFVALLKKG